MLSVTGCPAAGGGVGAGWGTELPPHAASPAQEAVRIAAAAAQRPPWRPARPGRPGRSRGADDGRRAGDAAASAVLAGKLSPSCSGCRWRGVRRRRSGARGQAGRPPWPARRDRPGVTGRGTDQAVAAVMKTLSQVSMLTSGPPACRVTDNPRSSEVRPAGPERAAPGPAGHPASIGSPSVAANRTPDGNQVGAEKSMGQSCRGCPAAASGPAGLGGSLASPARRQADPVPPASAPRRSGGQDLDKS